MSDEQEFEVIVHPLEDGSYWAEVDGLPGCLTQGASYSEILRHLRDAHEACCAALDLPAPDGTATQPDTAPLAAVITAGDLTRYLLSHGWQAVATGAHHTVYRATGRSECLAVLNGAETPLVPALVAALKRQLS